MPKINSIPVVYLTNPLSHHYPSCTISYQQTIYNKQWAKYINTSIPKSGIYLFIIFLKGLGTCYFMVLLNIIFYVPTDTFDTFAQKCS